MRKLDSQEDIYELLYAATLSAVLGTAIESGLLWSLAEKPMNAACVAATLNIPVRRCHYWLQLLDALGIVEWTPQGYIPTALARAAILERRSQESWRDLVADERERVSGVSNLATYIREPGSVWKAQGLNETRDYVEKMRREPARAREFVRMLYEVHQYLANEVAALVDLTGARRLMDLGGNSGVVSMALLRKYPDLCATVVDLENICIAGHELARELAAENGWSGRLSYYPAEFHQNDFPAEFDVIVKCDVSIYDPALLQKIWISLNPGGRLILVEHLAPEENILPAKRLRWGFLDSLEDPDFYTPTLDQVRGMLVHAGFELLPGEHTLSDQRILFEARRPQKEAAQ